MQDFLGRCVVEQNPAAMCVDWDCSNVNICAIKGFAFSIGIRFQ